jgi:hypothetical protein
MGRHRIVHVVTHALIDTERPELSGIVMSLVDECENSEMASCAWMNSLNWGPIS